MQGKVVVVTGAFGALGSVVARAFAEQGATVTLLDAATSVPPAVASQFGPPHIVRAGTDLADPELARIAMDAVRADLGRIDVLVNVAGGFRWQTLADGDVATWDLLYSINLKTAVAATKAVLPHLFERGVGRIVNVGAGAAARRTAAGMGAYAASKAGVQRLTESLADELKDRGITVNAVLPGTLDTAQNRADMADADFSRWVEPRALAEVILFLASDAARAVTGAALPVLGRA